MYMYSAYGVQYRQERAHGASDSGPEPPSPRHNDTFWAGFAGKPIYPQAAALARFSVP